MVDQRNAGSATGGESINSKLLQTLELGEHAWEWLLGVLAQGGQDRKVDKREFINMGHSSHLVK